MRSIETYFRVQDLNHQLLSLIYFVMVDWLICRECYSCKRLSDDCRITCLLQQLAEWTSDPAEHSYSPRQDSCNRGQLSVKLSAVNEAARLLAVNQVANCLSSRQLSDSCRLPLYSMSSCLAKCHLSIKLILVIQAAITCKAPSKLSALS